jgi:hypothetical protein
MQVIGHGGHGGAERSTELVKVRKQIVLVLVVEAQWE